MDIELDETGQDWRVYLKLVDKGGSPKRNSEITTGLWRLESGKLYATPIMTQFNEYGVMTITFPERAPFLDGAPAEIDSDSGDAWHKFQTSIWPKVKAVSYDEYEAARESGRWADGQATKSRDAMGGNNPPEDATEKLLREARENHAKAVKLAAAGKAKTQAEADAAAILVKTLSTQRADLAEAHKKEKAPHLEAGRLVDRKYLDLIADMNTAGVDVKRRVSDPFLQEQERIANEAKAAAQAAAQKVIDEAEARARQEAADKGEPVTDEQWQAAAPAVTLETPKVTSGVKGARVALRDVRSGKVVDYERFASSLAKARNSDLLTLLNTLGHKMASGPFGANFKHGEIIYPGLQMVIERKS